MSSQPATPSSTPAAPLTTIRNIGRHQSQPITLHGWLYNLRSSGKLLFPTFRDGTGTIQGIVPKAQVPKALFDTLKSLQLESSVIVTGTVRADPRAPSGFELDVTDLRVVSAVSPETPFPITLKEHGVDFLMEHRHLWLRTPRQSAILRVRATIMRAAAEYFDTHGFVRTDPPILTPNACEGTSELFEMVYFEDDKAYLTQSGQLYLEATALALGKVYSFGPTFRAEKSKTRRHLTEFWMVEPELAFATLDDIMDLAEAFLTHILARVLEHHRADLTTIGRDLSKLDAILTPTSPHDTHEALTMPSVAPSQDVSSRPEASRSDAVAERPAVGPAQAQAGAPHLASNTVSSRPQAAQSDAVVERPASLPTPPSPPREPESSGEPQGPPVQASPATPSTETPNANSQLPPRRFPRLSYDQAHAMLEDAYSKGLIPHPHIVGDDFGAPDETYLSSQFDTPVLIHRYPSAIKAFYMQPDPDNPARALCVDVLAPEGYGEIIGGSQRIDDFDLLKSRIEEHNLPLHAFQWYLDLRRFGSVPHGGFGMGIERVVAWICGLDHVRETIPFPRTLNRIYP